jgi:hypothetical protein
MEKSLLCINFSKLHISGYLHLSPFFGDIYFFIFNFWVSLREERPFGKLELFAAS